MSHLPYARDTSTHSFAEELFSLSPVVGGRLHPQVSCSNFELDETESTPKPHHHHAHKFSLQTFFSFVGPGLLSSAAFVDPGNIESDLQAGAYAGYQLLWVVATSTLVGFLFQSLAIRLGTVSGRDLATNCKLAFPQQRVRLLWAMTQVAIVASDIQEIVGSAVAFRLLFGFPLWVGCLLTGLDTITFLGLQATGLRKLEAVFGVCLLTLVVCFFGNFAVSQPSPELIAGGMIPTAMNHRVFIQAAGILGAIIMPHNIFLHSALVLSRDVDRTSPSSVKEATFYYTLESSLTLLMTFFVNAAIVSVFAHGFYSSTCAGVSTAIDGMEPPFACVEAGDLSLTTSQYCELDSTGRAGTCQPIGLQVAGEPLEKLLGSSARVMWAVGLLAAGQTSTVTGTYAGQFVMEGMLELHLPNWQRVAFTRSVSLVPALCVALVAANDRFAADRLDAWLNVVQMVQLPFALVPLLALCSSAQVMGDQFRLSNTEKRVGWALTAVVVLANAFLLHTMVGNTKGLVAAGGVGLAVVYVAVLVGFVRPQPAIAATLAEAAPLVATTHKLYST